MWTVATVLLLSVSATVYEPLKVTFATVTEKSYGAAFGKYRSEGSSQALFMYSESVSTNKQFVDEFLEPLAAELKHIVKFGAINCDTYDKFCRRMDPTAAWLEKPSILALPPLPMPESLMDTSEGVPAIKKQLLRVIPRDKVRILASADMEEFLTTASNIPKTIYLGEKKTPPFGYVALSNSMSDRIDFGYLNVMEEEGAKVAKKLLKVKDKDLPGLVAIKGKRKEIFRGDLKSTDEVFEWINVRSETYARGGGVDHREDESETPEWMTAKVPELSKRSGNTICYKQDSFCGIYISRSEISEETLAMLEATIADIAPKVAREAKVKLMWMDGSKEPDVMDYFEVEDRSVDAFVIMNPTSKKIKHTAPASGNKESIIDEITKLRSGDQRFKQKGELPPFVSRAQRSSGTVEDEL